MMDSENRFEGVNYGFDPVKDVEMIPLSKFLKDAFDYGNGKFAVGEKYTLKEWRRRRIKRLWT
jgi:hypothetical protein